VCLLEKDCGAKARGLRLSKRREGLEMGCKSVWLFYCRRGRLVNVSVASEKRETTCRVGEAVPQLACTPCAWGRQGSQARHSSIFYSETVVLNEAR